MLFRSAQFINESSDDKIPLPKTKDQLAWYQSLNEDQKNRISDYYQDKTKKDIKAAVLPSLRKGVSVISGTDKNVSVEYDDLIKQGFWGGAVYGVARSLPAMLGGFATRTALMYAQISDNIRQEMDSDPDMKNLSENEKLAVIAPIAVGSAALESLGFRNAISSSGVTNKIKIGRAHV